MKFIEEINKQQEYNNEYNDYDEMNSDKLIDDLFDSININK